MVSDAEIMRILSGVSSILCGFQEASEPEPEHLFFGGQGLLFIGPCAHCGEGYVTVLPARCPVCSVELRSIVHPFWSATPRRLALHLRWRKLVRAVSERIPLWMKISYNVAYMMAEDMRRKKALG